MNHLNPWPLPLLTAMVVGAVLPGAAFGQQFSIDSDSIITCSGVLEDTGGPMATYGNNENFTTTICASVPGDAISLNWIVFDLSQQLPNPLDRIRIWDGENTSAPFLGEYTGTQLQGLVSSATIYNFSGCLTVQFTSNGGGMGNFAAGITCYTPCERPTAVAVMSEPGPPAMVCVGEEITFDGTGSYAAAGFNIVEYNWEFDDGTTVDSPTATHSFAAPGEYMVQLNLVDDNGCVNSNVVDLQVLVSTTPSFAGTVESVETCLGATVDLNAVVAPTTWTGMPEATYGDGVYLPDDLGIPFNSELTFTQFESGQQLNTTDDLLSICANMEHSYMGDLVVQISCPNGQTAILHQQGGGGTFLGGANDNDGVVPTPGDCWQYCWSPTATLGTWANCAAFGTTPNVMSGGTPPGNALIPGTYSSVQPLSNLVGCPLNGTWTFTITDLWGADNGFLCDWSLNFNAAIIPDTSQFTPVLGSTIDSAGWSGPFLTPDPNEPLNALATPNGPGTYDYNFTVTDNFGCSYDTTIQITIAPIMEVDAGNEIGLCNDSLAMAGAITANGPPIGCTWTLTMYDQLGDGWDGGGTVTITVAGVPSTYSLAFGTQQSVSIPVTSGSTVTVTYNAGWYNNENSFTLFNNAGGVVYASPANPPGGVAWTGTATCSGPPPVGFVWTPATGLNDPGDPESMVWVTTPTMYYLAVYPTGHPECAVTDSVLVSPPPNLEPGEDAAITVCETWPVFLMTDSLGGTPATDGTWSNAQGPVASNFTPAANPPGSYSFTYTVSTPEGCLATSQLDITVIPDTDPTCCGIPDAGADNYSCNLTIELHATPGNTGVGEWSGPAGAMFANFQAPNTTVTMPAGGGGTHWFYWRENDGAYCNTVDSVQMTFTDTIIPTITTTDAVCYGYCDGTAQVDVAGGNTAVDFIYAWSSGTTTTSPDSVSGLCAGGYLLTLTDDNGCTASDSLFIDQPVLLEMDATVSLPVICSGDCDGQVLIEDAEAVAYSFDGGATWDTLPSLQDACEGLYHLRIRDAAGCLGVASIMVTGPPPVVAEFVWSPTPANVDDPVQYFHSTSTGADHYFWNIGNMAYSTQPDTVYRFSEQVPGAYQVCLTAYNYNNCADTVCHEVIIEDVLEPYVPNAFTPNGDGHNDVFFISTNIPVITKFEMLIYDRWGQLIYRTEDPNAPWIGSRNNSGAILASGVYTYRIRYEIARTETERELFGHVSLLK
ncbi:MAG: gliding motility-associated C-terminal domain-containing protein [Flavobacteriales bacterium]|nr:gliding motility-associated C-terminal domain-containing protein [Flavobacteriales bacterium]